MRSQDRALHYIVHHAVKMVVRHKEGLFYRGLNEQDANDDDFQEDPEAGFHHLSISQSNAHLTRKPEQSYDVQTHAGHSRSSQ